MKYSFPHQAFFVLFLFFSLTTFAQYSDKYAPRLTRIVFVIDGSGSMKEEMDGITKFELSKQIISKYLDSLARNNIKVETAVRVFGHQSPRSDKNCLDSKLEIAFGKNDAAFVRQKLQGITPQGWSPIAYSLEQAAKDFPDDPKAQNVIVVITDGIETCGGDPCAITKVFQQKRIALKPYIIGLGLDGKDQKFFNCAGKFYDVVNTTTFNEAMNTVITQSLNPTTVQINLINEFGKPTETNIEVSMVDSYSGKLLYNFVHALNDGGVSDTLSLDPAGKYDVFVHTLPPVSKKEVELVAGTHNIIAIDAPQGSLKLTESGYYKRETPLQCIIREKGKNDILIVQDFNTTRKYLTGSYFLEILTLPRITMDNVEISQGTTKEITVA
ncbi:MAG TPA: VWA domain-containing protein, partial [Chitinophagales bacterium]|nr:VWA domain-containing protein [Chitinophagales bacterium]